MTFYLWCCICVQYMNKQLQTLLQRPDIWQASAGNETAASIPTGFPELDQALHQHGWPLGAITELSTSRPGIGELELLQPTLAHRSQEARWTVLINPPHLPYGPALQHDGVNLSRLLILWPKTETDALWAAEQCLKSKACSSLLAWFPNPDTQQKNLRKLQLAAQHGHCWTVLFRSMEACCQPSPAALRITLGLENQLLKLIITKQRGGWSGQQVSLSRNHLLTSKQWSFHTLPAYNPASNSARPSQLKSTLLQQKPKKKSQQSSQPLSPSLGKQPPPYLIEQQPLGQTATPLY